IGGGPEIRDTAGALKKLNVRQTAVLALYARLSKSEQHRAFPSHRGRRIVLATNVAETSMTVPGIKYVIDPGTARISRYRYRTKVQSVPIEPISQASANQRKGRCGRVSEGFCIRRYSEDDCLSRPELPNPE
ncbi:helicase-related protein, partial [Salmonella enterica]|uniref:helicase-related protein n=1 Tax=Salmonella enterica TaxID=28901 RepID=UPI00398C3881